MKNYTYHDALAALGVGGAHPGGLNLTKEMVKCLRISPDSHVLDAGCGTGQTAAYLAKTYGCHVTALDLHPTMFKKAKQRFAAEKVNVSLIQGDIQATQLPDESFDVIIAESVTVFVDIEKTAKEYVRLLKKGGCLLDLEMTASTPFAPEDVQWFRDIYGIKAIPVADEWKKTFLQAGFNSAEQIKEKSVAQELHVPLKDSLKMTDFIPSDEIDPVLYDILERHYAITDQFSDRLLFAVYQAEK